MEYPFISKATFDSMVRTYLSNLPDCKRHKALVNRALLAEVKTILLDPKNVFTADKNTRTWALKRFYLEDLNVGEHRVMVKGTDKPVLVVENMYEVLCVTHAEVNRHGGQKQLWKTMTTNWGWIKQELTEQFVNNCAVCATRKTSSRPLAPRAVTARRFLSRVQVDLIDMSFNPDRDMRYICHVRDQFSKFSWARAVASNWATEVASYLFDLFHLIGSPPTILQSDHGKEFCDSVIQQLVHMWPSVKISSGRPANSQNTEQANGTLRQKLEKWMQDTGRTDWAFGLRFAVLSMNHSYCRLSKKTPFELVYGDRPRGNKKSILMCP